MSFEDFNKHCTEIEKGVEARRLEFKRSFKLGLLVTVATIALAVAVFIHGLSGGEFARNEIIVFIVLLILAFISLRYTALRSYTYKNQLLISGLAEQKFCLKSKIFSEFMSYFGKIAFKSNAFLPFHEIEPSTIIPEYDELKCEDYIEGEFNQMKVKIAETKLIKNIDGKPVDFFNGLIVLIDFSESRIKLRAKLSGKSVLINDNKKFCDLAQSKYKSFEEFKLEGELESKFEAYTTNRAEAEKFFTPEIINSVAGFSGFLSSLKNQQHEWDDALMHRFETTLMRMSQYLWAGISVSGNLSGLKLDFSTNNYLEGVFDPTKINELSSDIKAINCSVQCAAYDDKFLITLPHAHDLFEINSIFEEAIIEEDKRFLYELVRFISNITSGLNRIL